MDENTAHSNYEAYRNSETWRVLSDMVKYLFGRRCQNCYENERTLHVHHRTYRRLGHELLIDLTVLCEDCHKDFHDNHEYDSEAHKFRKKVQHEKPMDNSGREMV